MKLTAEPIYLPDNADWLTIEDAKIKAVWTIHEDPIPLKTDYTDKCGSCIFFHPKVGRYGGMSKGDCECGSIVCRSHKKCKKYRRKGRFD